MRNVGPALSKFRDAYTAMLAAAQDLRAALEDNARPVVEATGEIGVIQRVVADHFLLHVAAMTAPRRGCNHVAQPRQVAMALARELTAMKLTAIGAAFRRDHGTVICAIRSVAAHCATEPRFNLEVDLVREKCRAALSARARQP